MLNDRREGLLVALVSPTEPPTNPPGRPPTPPPPPWDTGACARPVPSGTKQKCKAKVKEESSSVTCHRRVSLQQTGWQRAHRCPLHLKSDELSIWSTRAAEYAAVHQDKASNVKQQSPSPPPPPGKDPYGKRTLGPQNPGYQSGAGGRSYPRTTMPNQPRNLPLQPTT